MRTQSPVLGASSCRSLMLIWRRTPRTSTSARLSSSGKISTTLAGMAKHIACYLEAVGDAHRHLVARFQVRIRHDVVCDLRNAEVYIELALRNRHYAHGVGERRRNHGSAKVLRMWRLLRNLACQSDTALKGPFENECHGAKGPSLKPGSIAGHAIELRVRAAVSAAQEDRHTLNLGDGLGRYDVNIAIGRILIGNCPAHVVNLRAQQEAGGNSGHPVVLLEILRDKV